MEVISPNMVKNGIVFRCFLFIPSEVYHGYSSRGAQNPFLDLSPILPNVFPISAIKILREGAQVLLAPDPCVVMQDYNVLKFF